MWLAIEHTTSYSYDGPVADSYTELRLRPRDGGGQRCSSFRLRIEPVRLGIHEYVDHFGNCVHHFDVLEPNHRLVATATSDVYTSSAYGGAASPATQLDRHDYLLPTTAAPRLPDGLPGVPPMAADADPLSRALELSTWIYRSLAYETGATHVHTTADEVLALGRGVCQDFAHVLIAACRSDGIPARYVSGYLYDPQHDGKDGASHAWVDVLTPQRGWVSLDPTHDREQDEHYVRVAVGRDYTDVPPTRGVYRGSGPERLEVRVRIRPLAA